MCSLSEWFACAPGLQVYEALNEMDFDAEADIFDEGSTRWPSSLQALVVPIDYLRLSHNLQTDAAREDEFLVPLRRASPWWDERAVLSRPNENGTAGLPSHARDAQDELDKLSPHGVAAIQIGFQAEEIADKLWDQGMASMVASGVLSHQTAANALAQIYSILSEECFRTTDSSRSPDDYFGKVHGRQHRWDVKLPLEGPVLRALQESLMWLRPLLFAAVGEDARLCEWSALVSDPGSRQQPLHWDTPYQPAAAPLFSIYIPLQNTCQSMGPTIMLPGYGVLPSYGNVQDVHIWYSNGVLVLDARSHTGEAHQEFIEEWCCGGDDGERTDTNVLSQWPHYQCTGRVGDAFVMCSQTIHSGGANSSSTRRVLLYYSVVGSGRPSAGRAPPQGTTYSIRKALRSVDLHLRNSGTWGQTARI
eukprot:scaffold7462_cov430-Prasinococcus_capsulatus_cf.AAC.5